MRRPHSKCTEALARVIVVAFATTALLSEKLASAQACCVAPGAMGVTRLGPHEAALSGASARAESQMGSFDSAGHFTQLPRGARDVMLEQSLFTTVRYLRRGQVSVVAPFVETMRAADGTSSAGGGIGDLRFSTRWDLVFPEDARPFPGLALNGGVVVPTGRSPEEATDVLGATATGTGTTQAWGGFALEQTSGPWLGGANATVTYRADRDVGPIRSSLSPRFAFGLAGAHAWQSGAVLSLATAWEIEDRARVDGVVIGGSSRRALRLTVAFQTDLGSLFASPAGSLRLVASLYATPPIPAVTAGESSTVGASLTFMMPWL